MNTKGRVTIPTDMDAVPETLDLLKRWGADAIRDCDGTEFPQELKDTGAKIYATYYTTRKDNAWAKANPDETQQCYIMTPFYTAEGGALTIPLMTGISRELMKVNDHDDIARWWEVIDRTTGEPLDAAAWHYDAATESVVIDAPAAYHEYTVSFLAYLIWDPVHMYNSVINDWKDVEHQIPFDVRQPKTHAYTLRRLREYLESHPYVNVVRFTTFFHLFTLVFDELRREKYVDWYGYSASVCPYILEQFEKEVGYKFRPEFIIDQGYYNNQYRVPSKEYKDFQAFQRREVAGLMKEMTDIVHEYGKEAMMFLGDHWIGCEPFMPEFQQSGVDAIVGSVGNGSTLRLISDIPGVKYTEGRFLPYFFPDTFHEGGDPVREAKENWVTARRAILRKPIDRIGYGGYLKLACEFPEFLDYVESVCNEFRELYENIKGTTPYCVKTVAVLNSWGQQRAWGCHMVHHALYQKQNYSYAGVIEALSGAPFDVKFISFDDIKADPRVLDGMDVKNIIMNMMNGAISDLVHAAFLGSEHLDMAACRDLLRSVEGVYFPKYTVKIDEDQLKAMTQQDFTDLFTAAAADYYAKKEAEITPPVMRELERVILLRVVDEYWMEHIDAMQDLRQGIRLRAYAQTNPVDAYKKESLEMFEEMVNAMKEETVRRLYSVRLRQNQEVKRERVASGITENVGGDGTVKKRPTRVVKVGRNDLCPCGSGLKWKKCTCKEYHS